MTMKLIAPILLSLSLASLNAEEPPERQLVDAARRGSLDEVKALLEQGVSVNAKGRFNITALWQAASRGHDDLFKFLIEKGAEVNIPDDVWHMSPLMMTRSPDLVSLLATRNAKGLGLKLNQAVLENNTKLIEAILKSGKLTANELSVAAEHARFTLRKEVLEQLEKSPGYSQNDVLPKPTEAALKRFAGNYVSDRLNEMRFVVAKLNDEFRLCLASPAFPLAAVGKGQFVRGTTTFEFKLLDGTVKSVDRKELFSSRTFKPRKIAFTESDANAAATKQQTDEPTIEVRGRWPAFRGLAARGLATGQNLPDKWDVTKNVNVRWKVPVQGLANSCPIVWDDRVFLTTAISADGNNDLRIGLYGSVDSVDDTSVHEWKLLCLDRDTGKTLWERTAHKGVPDVKRHLKSSQANSTPVTDGNFVVCIFNTGGMHCFDMDGNPVWKLDLGVLDSGAFHDKDYQWGFGSSPIIYRDTVIVQCDRQVDSFIAAYDLKTGSQIWRTPRDEVPSWGTPTVHETSSGPLLFANGTNFARCYNALSGDELWRLSGNAAVTVPTPFVAYGLAYVTSGYRPIQPIFAIRLDANGDLTEKHNQGIAWQKNRGGPYLPTPIVYRGYFYTCGNNGVVSCFDAVTGKQVYRKRVSAGRAASFTGSLVAADGIVYITAESGDVILLKAGPKYEIVGRQSLGDLCLSTPAIAGGTIYFRTQKHLIAIGRTEER